MTTSRFLSRLFTFALYRTRDLSTWAERILAGFLLRSQGIHSPNKVFSFTRPAELCALLAQALCCPRGAHVLEIGSHLGASAMYLAAGIAKREGHLYCVDTWWNDTMKSQGKKDTYDTFLANIKPVAEYITPIRSRSDEFDHALVKKPLQLVFIDGDHSYRGVKKDFEYILPLCSDDVTVAFHDTTSFEGVGRFVGELLQSGHWAIQGQVWSLVWIKRSKWRANMDGVLMVDNGSEGNPTVLVSVLMPVYNAERYVAEAVESILNQTFRDFEFIIINDGSTDKSLDILRRYEKSDSRIRLISRENRGTPVTLNEGIELARAPLIARMDADDISVSDRFLLQVAFLDAHPEVVACGTHASWIDPLGIPLNDSFVPPCIHEDIFRSLMEGNGAAIVHPTLMARRSVLESIGGYDERYRTSQDLDLFLRLGEVGRLANLPEVLLLYRHHLANKNYAKRQMQNENNRRIVLEAHERHGLPVPTDYSRNWPLHRPCDYFRMWGWNALEKGHRWAAFKYGLSSLRRRPLSRPTLKLLWCCLRGYCNE